jgi:glycosyltransferase involved in cell wall biosynthesis
MRFLIVNYEYPPVGGGAATAAEAIAKALVQLGHGVVVLSGRFKSLAALSERDGVFIRRIPTLRKAPDRGTLLEMISFLCAGLIFAPAVIRKHKIEAAIIFFSFPSGPIGLLGRWLCGVPYVLSLRGGDVPGAEPSLSAVHRLLTPIRRAVMKSSVAIVANSKGLQKMAEGADPFPVHVIPNGVDTNFFRPPAGQTDRRPTPLQILFVGRFQHQKNLSFLLEQLARLQPKSFELHLVGDGPQKKELKKRAEALGLTDLITWHGWVSRAELPAIYHSADCLINPSLYEGMPNVVAEAMACGLPVVASNVAGNNDLVRNGKNGFLFESNDPDGLIAAVTRLNDAHLRLRFQECARKAALELLSWENVATRYVELFSAKTPSVGISAVS